RDNAWRDLFNDIGGLGVDGTLAVDGVAQRIDHTATQFRSNGHFENTAGGLDRIAFGNAGVVAQNNRADGVALKVQCEAENVVGKLEHFALHHVGQTVNTRNTVGHGDNRALCANVGGSAQPFNAAFEQFADL